MSSGTSGPLRRAVLAALGAIEHPASQQDVLASGHVRDLAVSETGEVRFAFHLQPQDPGSLVRQSRQAVEAVAGVSDVKVDVQLPSSHGQGGDGAGTAAPSSGRSGLKPGSVPAPTPQPGLLPQIRHVVAVSSGKGGVGKSMVATNLAASMALEGKRVALLDADIYGPNIPIMLGEIRKPSVSGEKGKERIQPLSAHGVELMSLGLLMEKEQPAIMRGPLVAGILRQFLEQVSWSEGDVMVVDMPPGTGDAQLSLVQTIDLAGVVMVTTPQAVSTGDVRRGVRMFERVNTPVIGVVENMSGFACPHCGERLDIFGKGGGEVLAREMELPFLGEIPLDTAVREAGDRGVPTVISAPDSPSSQALRAVARKVLEALDELD
ncbi:MAG: Mrp/NBP35 family ATP-binding protein [Gemmatimonadota bacterium]